MRLNTLLDGIEGVSIRGSTDIVVTGISCNSRTVEKGNVFVAITGKKQDGNQFIHDAIAKGAVAIIFAGDKFFDNLKSTQVLVSGVREVYSRLSCRFFVYPTRSFHLAGITGTNGKTTLTYLLEALWKSAGYKTGVLGTVNTRYGDTILPASHTTPDAWDLQKTFACMRQAVVENVAMEVSSHGLHQERVAGCEFDQAIFTNLSQDHLDYHKNMEDYFQAKKMLFTKYLSASFKKNKRAIVNADDKYGRRIIQELSEKKISWESYGFKEASLYPKKYHLSLQGTEAELIGNGSRIRLKTKLIGRFNLLNSMAAVLSAGHRGLSVSEIEKGFLDFSGVPGRLERIDDKSGRLVFVDYAHTPDALYQVLRTLKELAPRKIITVFGCGGDRDKKKRPLMGYQASRFSDLCIVTNDNPRSEDPQTIVKEILPGIKRRHRVILDRKKAIETALSLAKKDDVVLIAGKGHEDYQIVGDRRIYFSDQEVVLSFPRHTTVRFTRREPRKLS